MYKIILFNSGKRIKTIETFRTYSETLDKYTQILKENQVLFPKKYMWDGKLSDYELALTGPVNTKKMDYFRNDLGALVEIKTPDDFIIKKLSNYDVEETFIYKNIGKKYDFKQLVKNLLTTESTKVVTSLNNKLVVEYYDSDHIDLFILKTTDDAIRLNNLIRDFAYGNNLGNFIFFNEPSKENKIQLFDKIVAYLGVDRWYLTSRVSTR